MTGPILKVPGSKWRLADWIVEHLPPHVCYLEPFFGSGAVFFSKAPSPKELVNDICGDTVNLFRVLRDQPEALCRAVGLTPYSREELEAALSCQCERGDIERARQFLVRSWMRFGYHSGGWRFTRQANAAAASVWAGLPDRIVWAAQRLKNAHIECRPAADVIRRAHGAEVLIYADPPYPHTTRRPGLYKHEMTLADHEELLSLLLAHPGPVLLSGYPCPLYEERLAGWRRVEAHSRTLRADLRTECLWLNPAAVRGLRAPSLPMEEVA